MPTVSLLINTEKYVYYSLPYNVVAVLLFWIGIVLKLVDVISLEIFCCWLGGSAFSFILRFLVILAISLPGKKRTVPFHLPVKELERG